MYKSSGVPAGVQCPDLGRWAHLWGTRKMLLYMQHRGRHLARQPPEVWQVFERLFLPVWDKDFRKRSPWKKLPVGTHMERMGGKLCPLDCRVEDHAHVFRHCFLSAFMFDTIRWAFGLVTHDGGTVEPSRLLLEHSLLSLTMTQGLVLWAGLKCPWGFRCRAKYQHLPPVLDEFVAGWAAILQRWRSERDMSCSRQDVQHLIRQLESWFENRDTPRMF